MKKYILFGFDLYYPSGGLNDKLDSYDSMEELMQSLTYHDYERYQIVDRDSWEVTYV